MHGIRSRWTLGRLRQVVTAGWSLLRQSSGDDAYERYLEHITHAHPAELPLGRSEFECRRQQQKWNGISRCC